MPTTPADEIRAAAQTLRQLVSAVNDDIAANPYWASSEHPPHAYPSLYARGVDGGLGGPVGALAAAMHPGVARALAKWLESFDGIDFSEHGPMSEDLTHALTVARLINQNQE